MFFTALITTFFVILPVELPDKTLVATLVLSTRYRPVPVLVGVSAAFFVQCVIAVTAGGLLTLLPHRLVLGLVAVLFAAGAVILLRERHDDDEVQTRPERTPVGMALASFGVLFAAEWGDASQLATAALTAKYTNPIAVFLGSWLALVGVAALAVLLGKQIRRRVPLSLIQRIAGTLFAAFAALVLVELIRS